MTNAPFQPITKHTLALAHPDNPDIRELCGPASITMLLATASTARSFEDIYETMRSNGSYVRGVGTYLQKAAALDRRLRYWHFMPCAILKYFLRSGGRCAASIHTDQGNHIVFVSRLSDTGGVTYYDPNLATVQPQTMPWRQWHQRTNHRVLILPHGSPKA